MALATVDDYTSRHGAGSERLQTLLDDASSFVQHEARLHIELATSTVQTRLDRGEVVLPEYPVVSIDSIVDRNDVTIDPDTYDCDEYGILSTCRGYTCGRVTVTYTHGWDPVPLWIVSLVCSTVQRATRPEAIAGVQGATAGSQSVQFATSLAGVNLWLTRQEAERLHALREPALA